MIETNIKKDFLDLFCHIIEDYKLDNENKLNLFSLEIKNTLFNMESLLDELDDNIIPFMLSRKQLKDMDDKFGGKKSRQARTKFRQFTSNEGELGEVLLYCFLESHLNAPKILSKYELKTSTNDYIKGADGVHLLKMDDSTYQLVFGESKLYGELTKGVYDAFSSITTFLKNKNDTYEEELINSNLNKEIFDENSYEVIKNILLPKRRITNNIDLDNSFAIFLGFNYELIENLKGNKAREKIKKDIEDIVMDSISSINFQLNKKNLKGYDFYIYTMPINNIESTRKEIIKRLTNG